MWLRVKIFIGYLVLISLLVFTVRLFRDEQIKRGYLQASEAELLHVRNLAEQVYAGLLELATRAETVSVWDEEDLAGYRDKRTEVCRTLQELGPHIRSSSGQARIDSLCLLLEQKEQLLDSVTQTFDHLQRVGEIVSRKFRPSSPMSGRPPPRLSHLRIPFGNRPRPAYGPGSSSGKKRNRPIWSSGKRRKKDPEKRDKRDKARRPPACSVP